MHVGRHIPAFLGPATVRRTPRFGKVLGGVCGGNCNRELQMPNLQEYMTIKDAAAFLGVTPNKLRNWGSTGKVSEYRNPINNYRLYKESDLSELLGKIEQTPRGLTNRP